METDISSSSIYDLMDLDRLRRDTQSDKKAALEEVAQKFESIFVAMMLKSMRDANQYFEQDSPMNTKYTKFYRDMYDQQLAEDLSKKKMIGIADLITQQLDPDYDKLIPASLMIGDRGFEPKEASNTELPRKVLPEKTPESSQPKETSLPDKTAISDIRDMPKSALAFDDLKDFVHRLSPHAQKTAKELGTSPAVILAQSALETGWGKQMIQRKDGSPSFNFFNIKADSRWQGETTQKHSFEFEQGVMQKKLSQFRAYHRIEDSFADYSNFLKSDPRYAKALEHAADPKAFTQHLQQAGYATDPNYSQKVMGVMARILNMLKEK